MVQYRETVELKVPLFVLRGLVAACDVNSQLLANESYAEVETNYRHAIKWLADRPIYREQCLSDEVVKAVYQRQTHEATP
jgi:hypothetical protein